MLKNTSFANNDFQFFKNLFLMVIFLFVTPITIGVSLFTLMSLDKTETKEPETLAQNTTANQPLSGVRVYASLPSELPSISAEVTGADARSAIVGQVLASYKAPLSQYSDVLVDNADKYGLDHRLLASIAMKESGGCRAIPYDSYNCWGWGIHSKGSLGFESYEQGIETVSRGLKENYVDKGLVTVEQIMTKYAHASSDTWAQGVNFYMDQMQ